jgi:hypothetical protein
MVANDPKVKEVFVLRPVDIINLQGVSAAAKIFEIAGVKPGAHTCLQPAWLYVRCWRARWV